MKLIKKNLVIFTLMAILFCFNFRVNAQNSILTTPGTFSIGCNYWASHAGTHMWRDWKPEVVEADFKQLSENGIKVLRVFPLWPDFQPIHQFYAGEGQPKYIGFTDGPLPNTSAGQNGMNELQLQHFKTLTELASKYHLKLVVGLITGWMSGQLYVPPALEGKNILTDPESLTWQQKFVTTFVSRFKDQPSIVAWDFGNECNVMQKVDNHYQAYVWSSVISGAIKSADQSRPIISGMHSLQAGEDDSWRIKDQGALTDLLTTHPYSLWTPYTNQAGINTMRTILHGAAETRLYSDLSGKPCLVEETGVMGPMTGGEDSKNAFARTALFSNWAHECQGTFWWCAYDQLSLQYSPYNYSSVENELGLIKEDRTVKPVLKEFKKFSAFIDQLPFKALPTFKTDAVCILSEGQENWPVAYSSFILAKQAGFDFKFQKANEELKDAKLYMLPSIKGIDPVFKGFWFKLLDKVKNGATLYISMDDAYLPTFTDPLGIEINTNTERKGDLKFSTTPLMDSQFNLQMVAERKYSINPKNVNVLGKEADGNPAFTESTYGKGKIYFLTFPLEMDAITKIGSFDDDAPAYSNIYKKIAAPIIENRIIQQENTSIGITEHYINENEAVVILINYNPKIADTELKLKAGWKISKSLYGEVPNSNKIQMKANDALVLICKR
ncbi:MAG: cellulase family glycosylhydrolase [Flavobacterium sp.]|nr:cellulase family glycosylhydrolase [Pedobacter sp.]